MRADESPHILLSSKPITLLKLFPPSSDVMGNLGEMGKENWNGGDGIER